MDPEERSSRKRVWDTLIDIIQRCGTEPFLVEEKKKEKEKDKEKEARFSK